VFLLSPKSCTDPWSDSGDRELDLNELTRRCCHPERPSPTGLTGAAHRSDRCKALWVLPRVNNLVSSLLSRIATVSSLGRFGARKVGLDFWGFTA
jgi:hypothetical protein